MADNTTNTTPAAASTKVLFKKGTKEALMAKTSYEPGCFYLTTDSHHLYIGTEDETLAKVNGNIHPVATLPTTGGEPGEFYYLPSQNILAYYDEEGGANGKGEWIQLNPDTDTDTIVEVSSIAMTKDTTNADNTKLVYNIALEQKVNNETDDNKKITGTLTISSDDVTSLVTETNVSVTSSTLNATDKSVTVSTEGAGASGAGFKIKGNGSVSLSADSKNEIIISGSEYSIERSGTSIELKESGDTDSSVKLAGDDTWISAEGSTKTEGTTSTEEIKFSHKQKEYTNGGVVTDSEQSLTSAGTFSAITGVSFDAAGHIDNITTKSYTLPNSTYSIEASKTEVKDTDDSVKYSYINSIQLKNGADEAGDAIAIDIALPITIDGTERVIKNGDSIGSYYSADEIDSRLKALNAMTYKGPVVSNSSEGDVLPELTFDGETLTSTIRIGDTYKVNKKGTYGYDKNGNVHECEVGYLLIANTESNENADGYIFEKLYWDLIEAGESSDTTYSLKRDSNTIQLKENVTEDAGTITFADDNIINLDLTGDDDAITVTASHYQPSFTPTDSGTTPLGYEGTFTAITGATKDDYGHITGITTSTFKLPVSDSIEATEGSATNGNAHSLVFKNGTDTQGSLTVKSGTDGLVTVSSTASDDGDLELTLGHKVENLATEGITDTDNPAFGSTFTALKSVETDGYGHINKIVTTTVTMPSETAYSLANPTKDTNGVVTSLLTAGADEAGQISLASDTLSLTVNSNHVIYADLVWGEF